LPGEAPETIPVDETVSEVIGPGLVGTFDKHVNLKIVGKPCEGKPHARFDEGRLGRPQGCTSFLLYDY